jgi:hypothetical protein
MYACQEPIALEEKLDGGLSSDEPLDASEEGLIALVMIFGIPGISPAPGWNAPLFQSLQRYTDCNQSANACSCLHHHSVMTMSPLRVGIFPDL